MQATVKALQLKSGSMGPWQQATLANGWTGHLNYRSAGNNQLQFSAYDLTPGTITDATILTTLTTTPVGNHEFGAAATGKACVVRITSTGVMQIYGLPGGASDLSFEVVIPLDI